MPQNSFAAAISFAMQFPVPGQKFVKSLRVNKIDYAFENKKVRLKKIS
jgi:hypothetical protein